MKKTQNLIPLLNPMSETIRETIEESAKSQKDIATATGIPSPHLSGIKSGKRRLTPEHDLRLSTYFGLTPGFFLRLQTHHDLALAEREKGEAIRAQVKRREVVTI